MQIQNNERHNFRELRVIRSTVGESPPIWPLIPIHRNQSRKQEKTLLKWMKGNGRNSEN
jgi:hypothetical protein